MDKSKRCLLKRKKITIFKTKADVKNVQNTVFLKSEFKNIRSFMGYQIKTSGDTDPCPILLSPLHVHATPIDLFPESYRIWVGANIKRNYDANLRKLNLAIKQFKSKILNKTTAGLIQLWEGSVPSELTQS